MANQDDRQATTSPRWFRIGWWNSRLTPPKGNSLPNDERGLVLSVITRLIHGLDILFLGEVTEKDLSWLKSSFNSDKSLRFNWSTNTLSRGKFNIGAIYKHEIISLGSPIFKIAEINSHTHKIAAEFDAEIFGEVAVKFLVSHWPSRARLPAEYEDRSFLGDRLRQEVNKHLSLGQKNLILLGDYNDEPYNRSLTDSLQVTRHPSYLLKNKSFLYNPFWKHMLPKPGYQIGKAPTATGTYYYRKTPLSRWLVFDQMMFSSGFVGSSDWHLLEESVQVVRLAELVEAIESTSSKLDHLPIIAAIEKVTDD